MRNNLMLWFAAITKLQHHHEFHETSFYTCTFQLKSVSSIWLVPQAIANTYQTLISGHDLFYYLLCGPEYQQSKEAIVHQTTLLLKELKFGLILRQTALLQAIFYLANVLLLYLLLFQTQQRFVDLNCLQYTACDILTHYWFSWALFYFQKLLNGHHFDEPTTNLKVFMTLFLTVNLKFIA